MESLSSRIWSKWRTRARRRLSFSFRHWHIHDSQGEDSEVDGEGVLGKQPTLEPGKSHVYQSFCVLRSPLGFMEGYYTFVRPSGEEFRVPVPRFELRAPWTVGGAGDSDLMN